MEVLKESAKLEQLLVNFQVHFRKRERKLLFSKWVHIVQIINLLVFKIECVLCRGYTISKFLCQVGMG